MLHIFPSSNATISHFKTLHFPLSNAEMLFYRYINFLAEMVESDDNKPVSGQKKAPPPVKKVVIHTLRGIVDFLALKTTYLG